MIHILLQFLEETTQNPSWLQQASEWIRNNLFVIDIPIYSILTGLLTFLGVKISKIQNAKQITDSVLNKLVARFEVINDKIKNTQVKSVEELNALKSDFNIVSTSILDILNDIKETVVRKDFKDKLQAEIEALAKVLENYTYEIAEKVDGEEQANESKV